MDRVCFLFRLPPVLLVGVTFGAWPRAPRGCTLEVEGNGAVTVSCSDGLETYAVDQVLATAASFLREIDRNAPPTMMPARLVFPRGRGSSVAYAISIGARVSIARTAFAPILAAAKEKPELNVVG